MRQIKGTFFKKVVMIIRADKSGMYDPYLTKEDKDIISTTILSSSWYPWESFKRCFKALFEVHAKGSMEMCRQWGRNDSQELTESAYKSVMRDNDYKNAFQKIQLFWKLQFDFGELDVDFNSDTSMKIIFKDFDPDAELFYHFVKGWYEKVLEMCDRKIVTSEFSTKSWEGAGDTSIQFSWSR